MPKISERLVSLQKERNVQKKDIAEAAGLSLMGYYRYEKGEREPTASTICKLCDFFNVSADYLLGRTDEP
jgi:transcriptional regulator with XRE-family HTH domain